MAITIAPAASLDFTSLFIKRHEKPSPLASKFEQSQLVRNDIADSWDRSWNPSRVLAEKQAKADEARAEALMHIIAKASAESVKAMQGAANAKAAEQANKENLVNSLSLKLTSTACAREEQKKKMMENFSKRDFLALAAKEARAQQQAALQLKASSATQKASSATQKREKLITARIERNAAAFRHAKDMALKVREQDRAQAEQKLQVLQDKTEGAAQAHAAATQQRKDTAHRAVTHARAVAARQKHEVVLAAEQRAQAFSKAQASAASRRSDAVAAIASKSAGFSEAALARADAAQQRQSAEAATTQHALMQKLQQAECRRLQAQSPRMQFGFTAKTPPPAADRLAVAGEPVGLASVDFRRPGVSAPAALEARLLQPSLHTHRTLDAALPNLAPDSALSPAIAAKQRAAAHNFHVMLVVFSQRHARATHTRALRATTAASAATAATRRTAILQARALRAAQLGSTQVRAAADRRKLSLWQHVVKQRAAETARHAVATALRATSLAARQRRAGIASARVLRHAVTRGHENNRRARQATEAVERELAASERRAKLVRARRERAAKASLRQVCATQARLAMQSARKERGMQLQQRMEAAAARRMWQQCARCAAELSRKRSFSQKMPQAK